MSLRSLSKKWLSSKTDDVYTSVEDFMEGASSTHWPYAVLVDQIESGWSNETRGALALNLARGYIPEDHALAALMVLGGPWPTTDATAALNLLGLAHHVHGPGRGLARLISHAALFCLRHGLEDNRPLVAEHAVNVLGGLGPDHFHTASAVDLQGFAVLARAVITGIDDRALADALSGRVAASLREADGNGHALSEEEVAPVLKELDPFWSALSTTSGDAPIVAMLRTHLTALAWRFGSIGPGAVQVVYAYSTRTGDDEAPSPYRVMDPWFRFVRDLLLSTDSTPPENDTVPFRAVSFDTLHATGGSLLVTLRVTAGSEIEEKLSRELRAAKDKPPVGAGATELADLLARGDLHVRVAHVDAALTSASLAFSPGPKKDDANMAPLRARKLATIEIPQANELERIFAVVECIAKEIPVMPEDIGVSTARQVQYYKAAARLLELMTATGAQLTRAGWLLHVAERDDRYRRLCAAFEASPCGQSWLEWAQVAKLKEVPANSAAAFLAERSELSGDTISRRANTLNVWLETLRPY